MKISIENRQFTYSVDYSKLKVGEKDYYPSAKDCIEDFLSLLENEFRRETISDALTEGLVAMEYSKKGRVALKALEMANTEGS